MTPEFQDEFNRAVYAGWHLPLLERLFGDLIDLHHDLYELTHAHRRLHNGGTDDGPCTAWPSPPYRAPIWRLLAEEVRETRLLEVGTGLGYTAVLMAEAGGPDVQVHTIEVDPWHADLAEEQLARRGLSDRVEILRGDAALILPALIEPYDMVFADGGEQGLSTHLKRLTRPGGVPAEVKDKVREPLMNALAKLRGSLGDPGMDENGALAATREEYRAIVRRALKAT